MSFQPTERHIEFLRNLERMTYAAAVCALGDGARPALGIAFDCTLHGWVDRGMLTATGRALIADGPIKTNAFEITLLGEREPAQDKGGPR